MQAFLPLYPSVLQFSCGAFDGFMVRCVRLPCRPVSAVAGSGARLGWLHWGQQFTAFWSGVLSSLEARGWLWWLRDGDSGSSGRTPHHEGAVVHWATMSGGVHSPARHLAGGAL